MTPKTTPSKTIYEYFFDYDYYSNPFPVTKNEIFEEKIVDGCTMTCSTHDDTCPVGGGLTSLTGPEFTFIDQEPYTISALSDNNRGYFKVICMRCESILGDVFTNIAKIFQKEAPCFNSLMKV